MLLKKSLTVAALISACTLSTLASADLVINNLTNEESTVRVTNGAFKGQCTGTIVPDKYRVITPRNTTNFTVPWKNVMGLCFQAGDVCTAEIHMTTNCSDAPVANASLNIKNPAVTIIMPILNPKYDLSASGTTVTIKYHA